MKNQAVPGKWLYNSCSDAIDLEDSSVHGHMENHGVLSSSSQWRKQSHRSLQSSKEVSEAQVEWPKQVRGSTVNAFQHCPQVTTTQYSKKLPTAVCMSMTNVQSHSVHSPLIPIFILQCLALLLLITTH